MSATRRGSNRQCALGIVLIAGTALIASGSTARAQDPAAPKQAQQDEGPAVTMAQAQALLRKKDHAGAADAFAQITEREPENGRAWMLLGYCLHAQGDLDAALPAHRKAATFPELTGLASFNAACVLARLERKDEAFTWLQRAFDAGFVNLAAIESDQDLAGLRSDPRFAAFRTRPPNSPRPFLEEGPVILHDHFGEAAGDQFGWVARALGDLDGDGVTDYASTAPYSAAGGPFSGAVYVYSGKSGDLLWRLVGKAGEQLGWCVGPAGDVDRDGRDDYVIGAPGRGAARGTAYVISGKEGKVLRALPGAAPGDRFGADARTAGDANGDGVGDLIVGAPNHDAAGKDAGRAYLHSGKDGALLHTFDGEKAGDNFGGGGVAGWSGGSRHLLAISAVNAGPAQAGRVYAYGGKDYSRLFTIDAVPGSKNLGWFLALVDDVTGDGVPEIYATDWHDSTSKRASGRALLASGADGKSLLDLHGTIQGEGFGIGVGNAGDLDGDGTMDLIVGAWINAQTSKQAGKIYCHSGKTGALLGTLTGAIPGDVLGFDATGVGDVNADGIPDLLVTSAYNATNGAKAGRAYVVSGTYFRASLTKDAERK